MATINPHDRRDIDRAAKEAGVSVTYVGTNRTVIDGVTRYGRGDAMNYIKKSN
jgi:hypothetical protein